MRKAPKRSLQEANTLLEILVALALFASVAISLLVLFPMAQRSERESSAETRATLIASSIMETLEHPSAKGLLLLEIGRTNATPLWMELDSHPTNKTTQSVVYNSSCEPLRPLTSQEQLGPISDHEATTIATISLTPKASIPFLSTVEVEVATPASAPAPNRTIHRFVRLLNGTAPPTSRP